ncbi:hypothetical protein IT418_01845 [bacterium]|nr:hypothetical protein [bacterium]
MVECLFLGNLVWIAPTGRTDQNDQIHRWRKGIGRVARNCLQRGVNPHVAFIKQWHEELYIK